MSNWNREYQRLPKETKDAVNNLVNAIFAQESGVYTKIDPRTQPKLVHQWLAIRDNVMANRQRFNRWLNTASSAIADVTLALPIFRSLDTTPEWIRIARQELGQKRVPGKGSNPRVAAYIRSCTGKDQGDEAHWCACFVNWCLERADIRGLGTAWAPSWEYWPKARKVNGPQQGALMLVKFSWMKSKNKFDHIAFVDKKDGRFVMLGGNQGGDSRVSFDPFPWGETMVFFMPPGY